MEKSRNIIVQLKSELKTRQEAREFLLSLESVGLDDVLVFDFTHVRFVGRSFADEFLPYGKAQRIERIGRIIAWVQGIRRS